MVDSDDEVDRPPALNAVEAFEAIQNLLVRIRRDQLRAARPRARACPPVQQARHRTRAEKRYGRRRKVGTIATGTGPIAYAGADLDGDELTVVIALDPAWARITIITGF